MPKRFLKMARPWWSAIFITVLSLIAAAVLNLVTPELIRRMTALLTGSEIPTVKIILTYALILALSYILRGIMRFLAMWQAHVAAWNFVADMTHRVYEKLERLSISFFTTHTTGELLSRTINDTRNLETLIAHALPDLFSSIVIITLVCIMIFIINPVLAAATLIPVPIVLLISRLFSKKVMPLFRCNQQFLAELGSHVSDRLSGMKEIKAFCKEKKESENMLGYCNEYSRINIRANFANAIYQPSVEAIISMGTVIVMGVGGILAIGGRMEASDIVGFFMYLSMFYQPLSTLARVVEDIQSSCAGGERVIELLDMPEDSSNFGNELTQCEGKIEFSSVSFGYDSDGMVLNNVSFTVNPGETVAFVGETGAGKTTIMALLERFYQPESGKIFIDGKDISTLCTHSLRENISIVLQEVFLFNGSVYENIAYGRDNATKEEIEDAARLACADLFIDKLPQRYDTPLGERGARLSGGQKQRIAIARAILRKAPIIIFDEATSALDNETEAKIAEAIHNLSESHTVILIAHRLSTIKNADKIIVLSHGKISEYGTHDDLLRKKGEYAKMWNAV